MNEGSPVFSDDANLNAVVSRRKNDRVSLG
jgi:hypothetical protein